VIHTHALTRTFSTRSGPVQAVKGIDLDVGPGEIVGLLGPNGAGKTTTLRMLATLLRPTSGRATVAGHDLLRDRSGVRRRIGYVAQGGTTHPEARAGEEIVDQARLHGLPKARAVAAARETLARLDLDDVWDKTCRSLSGGRRRRLDIALGLVHSPQLVFLDEPTTGLDPQARSKLWEHLRDLRRDGTALVLTTHYLGEADALSDKVVIVDRGVVVASGTPEELKKQVAGEAVAVRRPTLDDVFHARTGRAPRGPNPEPLSLNA
jgi:ABC-2 type transport system ATP-binding protein